MQAQIEIIHVKDIIKMTPQGQLDFRTTEKLLVEILSRHTSADKIEILIDFRETRPVLSADQIGRFVAELEAYDPPFREKIAVLVDSLSKFEQMRIFVHHTHKNKELRLHVFDKMLDAVEWLFPTGAGSTASGA